MNNRTRERIRREAVRALKLPRVLFAKDHIAFGKNWRAFRFAKAIVESGKRILKKAGASQKEWRRFFDDEIVRMQTETLMMDALLNPERLRDIADVLIQLQDGGIKTVNDRAVKLELIAAYEECGGYRPPLSEIRRVFIARRGEKRWPGDTSARRTLKENWIPLGKDKLGRPRGAKSLQKMYGVGKQPRRKLVHKNG